MANFLETWVEDKARQRLTREIAVIESEWPAHTSTTMASGFTVLNGSQSASLLLSVPSSKWFKPRFMWVDNENVVTNHLMIYAGGSAAIATATIGGMYIGPRETNFIAMDCVTVGKDLWIDGTYASCSIRIGGILVESGPEN